MRVSQRAGHPSLAAIEDTAASDLVPRTHFRPPLRRVSHIWCQKAAPALLLGLSMLGLPVAFEVRDPERAERGPASHRARHTALDTRICFLGLKKGEHCVMRHRRMPRAFLFDAQRHARSLGLRFAGLQGRTRLLFHRCRPEESRLLHVGAASAADVISNGDCKVELSISAYVTGARFSRKNTNSHRFC